MKITTNNIQQKSFNYEKGGIRLNFVLRTDTPEDMEIFVELLEAAQADVLAEIEKGK